MLCQDGMEPGPMGEGPMTGRGWGPCARPKPAGMALDMDPGWRGKAMVAVMDGDLAGGGGYGRVDGRGHGWRGWLWPRLWEK